ncbi:viroplasmin family protein [Ruminococcus sp. 5_1_39BFAA]|uniref:ribonuclease H1 domain-containing protein n=1 Tax=Ruminococcus sp. 5_1_39BFAA TaxID=457412 RepID=UPI003567A161
MAKKYYAVRKGRQTGVFETWAQCQRQVTGFSGAEFKSFPTREEALRFVGEGSTEAVELLESSGDGENGLEHLEALSGAMGVDETDREKVVEAYVDGSFYPGKPEFSYGMVILRDGKELKFSKKFEDKELAMMHNVAGEIKGAEAAMQYALDNRLEKIIIYHDYEGIAKWCTGAWKATKSGTQSYQAFYREASKKVDIRFVKVKGHSNNKYNNVADELAKEALGIGFQSSSIT